MIRGRKRAKNWRSSWNEVSGGGRRGGERGGEEVEGRADGEGRGTVMGGGGGGVGFNHRAAKDAAARPPLLLSCTANTHLCSSFMKWTSLLTSPLGAADKRASTFMTKSLALEVGNNNGVLMHRMDGLSQSVQTGKVRLCRHDKPTLPHIF